MVKKLLISLLPILVLGVAAKQAHAVGVIPDDGTTSSLSSSSPPYATGKYNPPTNTWPDGNSFNGNIEPYYVVGNNTSQYDYEDTFTTLYMQPNTSVAVNVSNGGPDCHTFSSPGVVGPDYNQSGADGGPLTIFRIVGPNGIVASKTATSYDDCTFSISFSLNAGQGYNDPNGLGGYTKYLYLWAETPAGTIQGENSYWVYANVTQGNAALAYSPNLTGYGYRANGGSSLNIDNGNYWTSDLLLGANQTCSTLGQTQPGTITYADMDASNTSWNPAIWIQLQRRPYGGGSWSQAPASGGYKGYETYSDLLSQNNGTNTLVYNYPFDPNFVYRVILHNVGVRNTIFVAIAGNISALGAKYHLNTSDCLSFKCTANGQTTFMDKNMSAGQSVGVTWTFTNTGQTPWTPTDNPLTQYRRQVNGQWYSPITVPTTVNPGGSFSINTTETAPTNTGPNPKVIKYTMWISTVGVMQGTPCYSQLYLGNPPPGPHGTISSLCTDTTVQIWSAATDWYYVYTYHGPGSGGYFTQQAPDLGADTWSYIPLPDPAPPPAATPGSDYTGSDPLFPGITSTWYWYGTLRSQQTETPATVLPYKVQFFDVNGNPVGSPYYGTIQNAANQGGGISYGSDTQDTFITMGPALWPHNAYSASLYGEPQSSDFYNKNGPYTYNTYLSSTPVNNGDTCLHASGQSACQGGSSVNLEVGQSSSVTYNVQLTNDTRKTFSSGYTMTIYPTGGLILNNDSATKTVTVPGGPGQVTVSGTWNVISHYNGGYSISFGFGGSQILPIDDWSGTCGGVSTQAHTLPYFQVWWGDIRAGGGFASPSGSPSTKIIGSCGGNGDPVYISPAAGSAGGSEAGGIRAFARASSKLGSQVDFGALAMGSIDGSAGGPIGFFSGDGVNGNPAFANTTGQMGGYLNGSAPLFCQKDFFNDTQSSPASSSGNLQTDINSCSGRCQYISNTGMTIGGASLPAGKQVTLYVDGDVTIAGNINYPASFSTANQTDIPYLTIIANGNIKLTAGVTHLDGLYIAQPTSSSNGIFETCNDVCTSQLVINGAVIAQHMELLRSYGTLDQPPNDVNGVGNKPAEIINYVPSMVIGAPAFAAYYGQTEGLFSLAPVF